MRSSGEAAGGSLGSSLYDPVEPGPPGPGGLVPHPGAQQLPGSRPARTGSLLGGASSLPVAGASPLLRFSGEPGGRARSLPYAAPPARVRAHSPTHSVAPSAQGHAPSAAEVGCCFLACTDILVVPHNTAVVAILPTPFVSVPSLVCDLVWRVSAPQT